MATKPRPQVDPVVVAEVTPEVVAEVTPEVVAEVTPEVVAEVTPPPTPEVTAQVALKDGPEIVYFGGEAAKSVPFTINPNALRYEVHANGIVLETMK